MTDIVFDLPVRIHWTPGPAVSDWLIRAVRLSRPLSVVLNLASVDELRPLGLPWEGTSFSAVLDGWKCHRGPLPAEGVDRWEFPVEDPGDVNGILAESFFGLPASRTVLRWTVRGGKMNRLPEMILSAARLGCALALPNRTADAINSLGDGAYPDPAELDESVIDRVRKAAGALSPSALKVHDYILSKALGCEAAQTGGCQAANSIAFVDEDGVVYPCESFKVAVGNLDRMDMRSIWSSPARMDILKEIASVPEICRTCADLPVCRGGCRGEAFHLTGRHGNPDPMCPHREASPCD